MTNVEENILLMRPKKYFPFQRPLFKKQLFSDAAPDLPLLSSSPIVSQSL